MKKREPSPETDRDEKASRPGSRRRPNSSLAANPVLDLQRTIGNRAVTEMLASRPSQQKVRVSQPGEAAEVEADRIAQDVAGSADSETSHAKSRQAGALEIAWSTAEKADANLGPGQAMDETVRRSMEAGLGHDFSGVKVHTDAKAAEAAQALNARAYTVGSEIIFGAGEYSPHTQPGKRLIAHELTHVAQQGASRPMGSPAKQPVKSGAQVSKGKVIQRQPAPTSQAGPGTSQPAPQAPPQLTQALYDKAIAILAKLPSADPAIVAILKQGKVGKRVPGVKLVTAAPATPGGPSVQATFDLEISPVAAGLRQGVAARFIEEPAKQTTVNSDPIKGISITRLLKIIAEPAASDNDLARTLLHEGVHMLLGIDRMLDRYAGVVPGLTAGATGALKSFSQYQQAGRKSSKRAALVAGLVKEIDRVKPPAAPGPKPGPGTAPSPSPAPSAPAPASPAVRSSADVADLAIEEILEERFAYDQQVKQFPGSRTVANSPLADAYMFNQLAFGPGLKSWPKVPNRAALVALMTAFLDDVELILNPPAAKPKPGPSTQPKKP